MDESNTTHDTLSASQPNLNEKRGRSESRKRILSNDDNEMKPPQSRQRSRSISRPSKTTTTGQADPDPVMFKTHGQSFNMSKLIETTILKSNVIESVIPPIIDKVKTDILQEFKSILTETITKALSEAVEPLHKALKQQEAEISILSVKEPL